MANAPTSVLAKRSRNNQYASFSLASTPIDQTTWPQYSSPPPPQRKGSGAQASKVDGRTTTTTTTTATTTRASETNPARRTSPASASGLPSCGNDTENEPGSQSTATAPPATTAMTASRSDAWGSPTPGTSGEENYRTHHLAYSGHAPTVPTTGSPTGLSTELTIVDTSVADFSAAESPSSTADTHAVDSISALLEEMTLPAPISSHLPMFPARLIDQRLQIQPSKIKFITRKRCDELFSLGLGLRLEPAQSTIQEFLDRTVLPRGGLGAFSLGVRREGDVVEAVDAGAEGDAGGEEVGGGGKGRVGRGQRQDNTADDRWRLQNMTVVYSEVSGWMFLHQVTKEAVVTVRWIVANVYCEEIGVQMGPALSNDRFLALSGMINVFNECKDVLVDRDDAVVKISGTREAVENSSRAIRAVLRGTERVDNTSARWYFGGDTNPLCRAPVTVHPMTSDVSAELDRAYLAYLADGHTMGFYTFRSQTYHVDFTQMLQRNSVTGTTRAVERLVPLRPEPPLPRCPSNQIPLTTFREGTTFSVVGVSQEEANIVISAVYRSMPYWPVLKVEHIWNSFLWGHYAQNAKSIGNEMLLFHGASSAAINQICRTGFDRRLAGSKHGAVYGKGCYFARDALFSAMYMDVHGGCQMLMAKVLVGEYSTGTGGLTRPPSLYPSGQRSYDSTVDDPLMPKIYVTYKDWQAYPMYVITFAPRPTPPV